MSNILSWIELFKLFSHSNQKEIQTCKKLWLNFSLTLHNSYKTIWTILFNFSCQLTAQTSRRHIFHRKFCGPVPCVTKNFSFAKSVFVQPSCRAHNQFMEGHKSWLRTDLNSIENSSPRLCSELVLRCRTHTMRVFL